VRANQISKLKTLYITFASDCTIAG